MRGVPQASAAQTGYTERCRSGPAAPTRYDRSSPPHAAGMPSSSVRSTSVLSPRMVRVTGATIISFRLSITSSRVSTRTGRRLSGSRKVYQRISPRINGTLPIHLRPTRSIRLRWKTRRRLVAQPCKPVYPPCRARQSNGVGGCARCLLAMLPAALCRRQ